MTTATEALRGIWELAAGDARALERVSLRGQDPVLSSIFRVGAVAGASIAASGLAASELWRLRTGQAESVDVDLRAAAAAFRSERYLRIAGERPPRVWGPVAGYYPTDDGRWVQLHTNFPHHHAGMVELLDCDDTREAVAQAIAGWQGQALEDAIAERGLCGGLLRSGEQWGAHPQSQALADLPVFEILPLAESDPLPLEPIDPAVDGGRPLDGVRVLDLTRVIAGPVCGRSLASHGAEVLRLCAPHLPTLPTVWLDMAQGKRAAWLDLRQADEREQLRGLIRDCDVFVQGYRPGTLATRGFGPGEVASLRPGVVYVSLSAYSHAGPWAERRGFDSLVQTVSGLGRAGAEAAGVEGTQPLPCQALDHASGYLAAMGAMIGLARRAQQGGSWHVRVSLAQTGGWIWNLGRVEGGLDHPEQRLDDVRDLLIETQTEEGPTSTMGPPLTMLATPPRWDQPAVSLGTHAPRWRDQARD